MTIVFIISLVSMAIVMIPLALAAAMAMFLLIRSLWREVKDS